MIVGEQHAAAPRHSAAERQIRGSTLLLIGRFLSKGTNFAVQVLTVRYLSLTDYGAFAYAMSIVQLGQRVATLGLDRSTTRFVPMYHERGDYDRLFGTLALTLGTVLALGIAIVVGLDVAAGSRVWLVPEEQKYALLLILVFLIPIEALDDLVVGLFAVFAKPRAIFFRRHVLAPGLKLAVVLLLVYGHSSVLFLAYGYVFSSVIGVSAYLVMLARMMRRDRLFERFSLTNLKIPWREVLAFTVPLLTTDLVPIVMASMSVLVLEHYQGLIEVARLRAQQPIAAMNQVVMVSFATLFTPMAARMFARGERHEVNDLYWQTAMWIAVLSFPLFALTFSIAQPLTTLLLGPRYQDSAVLLAILSFGYYFNAALGFNGLTLKIYGRLRYVIGISLLTVFINLVASLALIPTYGAVGAAIGTCAALIAHNVLKQAGLRHGTGINLFEWYYFRGYVVILTAALGLLVVQWMSDPSVPISLMLAAAASWLVFRFNRHLLHVERTFPELLRQPLMKRVLGLEPTA
jgi:O-antigen/teichoic acid export membrane protein